MPSLTILLALAAPFLSLTSAGPIAHAGKLIVYHATADSFDLGAQAGCLDVNGRLVSDLGKCANFTLKNDASFTASTSAGECGIHVPGEPENPDDKGYGITAFRCKQGIVTSYIDQLDYFEIGTVPYAVTVHGSGVNVMWMVRELPGNGKSAVDFFPAGEEYGQGSIPMLMVWG